jgi:hypothetical protein
MCFADKAQHAAVQAAFVMRSKERGRFRDPLVGDCVARASCTMVDDFSILIIAYERREARNAAATGRPESVGCVEQI